MDSSYRGKPLQSYSKAELIDIVEEQAAARKKDHEEFRKDLNVAYDFGHSPSVPVRIGMGWVLVIWGFVMMGIFVFAATQYRFQHETLTETQLTLWSLQHWWQWAPGALMALLGLILVNVKSKKKES